MALTPKQRAFVNEYLVDRNGTQAAIRAGYSQKTANEQASRLLANVNVKAAVLEASEKVIEKAGIDAAWVLKKAAEAYEINAAIKHNDDGDREMINAAAAARFLELAGKHVDVNAFKENVDHKSSDGSMTPQPTRIEIVAPGDNSKG